MKTVSPLKEKPLPNPGSSVDAELEKIANDFNENWVLFLAVMFGLTIMEWFRDYFSISPSPRIFTAITILVAMVVIPKMFRVRKELRQLRQGRDGEIAVAQYLERCREHGATVFHDIPGENFNLDHVVIDRSGVYVVETKTISKPEKGESKLTYDGNTISCPGLFSTSDPVIQVSAGKTWLHALLRASTGRDLPKHLIRPVVVYPGWFVVSTPSARNSEVWVLNPKALPSFISNGNYALSDEDVNLYAYHLSRYIRTTPTAS